MFKFKSSSLVKCRLLSVPHAATRVTVGTIFLNCYHSVPSMPESGMTTLPRKPRYPCPFISAQEIRKYLPVLYRSDWFISIGKSNNNSSVPCTMLAKHVALESPESAVSFMQETEETVIKPENHHPTWERLENVVHVRVLTHSALAPEGRKNKNDQHDSGIEISQKRPGITLRDIRFALLVEKLLLNYPTQKSDSVSSLFQPTDFDLVHNLCPLHSTTDENTSG